MIDLAILTTSAWTALQPLLPVIATKGAEELGKQAGGALWTAVKKKFDTKAAAKEALEDLLKSPADSDLQAAFRVQLKKLLEEDSVFAGHLEELLKASRNQVDVGSRGVYAGGDVSGSTIITGNGNVVGDGNRVIRKG